jgi:hypothetical protein
MSDARFEDGAERAIRLRAETPGDLEVISALLQDAVGETGRIAWAARHRRFTLLLNRFRWEDAVGAARQKRPYERVQSLLSVESVLRARSNGLDPAEPDTVISILALRFRPGEDGAGVLVVTLAGDGEIALDVECLDVTLADVSKPYAASAKTVPDHGDG